MHFFLNILFDIFRKRFVEQGSSGGAARRGRGQFDQRRTGQEGEVRNNAGVSSNDRKNNWKNAGVYSGVQFFLFEDLLQLL